MAKNSSKQLTCLLDDIVLFHLDFTVYTTLCLTAPISMPCPWDHDIGITELGSSASRTCQKCEFVDRFGHDIIRQHRTTTKLRIHNSTYIAEPTSKGYISLHPVAKGIEIKRKTRHAARTASTCFETSTTLFERWRHIASTLIKMSIRYAKTIDG